MKKLKIYLDTSVISYLDQMDSQEKMEITNSLWKEFQDNKYEIVISNVVIEEIQKCSKEKLDILLCFLNKIKYTIFQENEESLYLAREYINAEILGQNDLNDCRHISCAIIANCDIILSWNFRHLVSYKTIVGVKAVNAINNYREIMIYEPTVMLERDDENEQKF